jgi:hypothetical protein
MDVQKDMSEKIYEGAINLDRIAVHGGGDKPHKIWIFPLNFS